MGARLKRMICSKDVGRTVSAHVAPWLKILKPLENHGHCRSVLLLSLCTILHAAFAYCSTCAAQVPSKQHGLEAKDRHTWRRVLQWPEECERGFREYQKDFPGESGIDFFRLGRGKYLVEIQCSAGSDLFMSYDETHRSPARLLIFKEILQENSAGGSNQNSRIRYLVTSFDESTRDLWIYWKSIVDGGCRFARYRFTASGRPIFTRSGRLSCTEIGLKKEEPERRCEARFYFGARFNGFKKGEGYSAFCYKLQSRLIKAVREGDVREIKQTLRYGANPNLPLDQSFPPLLVAVWSGQADSASLLIDNGADVNDHADFERTGLNIAANRGYVDVVRVLVDRGADVCYRSSVGTAGDIAAAAAHYDIARLLKTAEANRCK